MLLVLRNHRPALFPKLPLPALVSATLPAPGKIAHKQHHTGAILPAHQRNDSYEPQVLEELSRIHRSESVKDEYALPRSQKRLHISPCGYMSRVKRIPERHFVLLEEPGVSAAENRLIVLAMLSAQISDLHLQELFAQKPHKSQYFLQSIEILADFLKESRAKRRYFIR
jgi:hypothetical protein